MLSQTEASLFLTSVFEREVTASEEDVMYAYVTYIAENAESLNLVEGEKVYVIGMLNAFLYLFDLLAHVDFNCLHFINLLEKHNEDWWFVKKPLTEERGWVPSQYLMDADSYADYVQTKLNEKIDKLPVFESKFLYISRG